MAIGLIQDATQFIENWVPRKVYHTEARYLDDLKMQMQKKFIVKQPFMMAAKKVLFSIDDGHGFNIGVIKKIGPDVEALGIIFKKDLQQLGELKRLITQIEQEEKKFNNLIVLLMGKTDIDMKEKLTAYLLGRGLESNILIVTK